MARPRRRPKPKSWGERLGVLVDPKTIAAVLIVVGGWAENRRHTDTSGAETDGEMRQVRAYVATLDHRADSLVARVLGLEAHVESLQRDARDARRAGSRLPLATSLDSPPSMGPAWKPERGGLLKAMFGWMPH